MFLSMNWIGDFVDLSGLDRLALIHRFSLSTAEVENEIFHKGSDVEGIVIAQILSVQPHPESKKLHLLKVDCGQDAPVDVVCGAPNVRVGMKTVFAPLGARIGEITIAPRALAGQTSYGMCCSEAEIGISDNNAGIMEITDDIPNGTPFKQAYQMDDIVFEVDNKSLTNRPDLWGHYGIAREFAALTGRPLKPIDVADLTLYKNLPSVDMKIEDPLCQRYSCLKVENILRSQSPVNMRIRLYYCGMRAINFLADLTNYLMLELGQPMHAFDSRRVEKLRIRRFPEAFDFTTLDGVVRHIDSDMLMICNDKTPICIAGIMGGQNSEIVEDTTTLTLESATFDAVSVRKSTVRLSHRTDASMRYEKCLDPEMTVVAIGRFVKLMQDADPNARVVSALTDEYAYHYPTVQFSFDKSYVDRYTGIDIDDKTILHTLKSLGFCVALDGTTFDVTVPSWRATKDVTMKADIIEEITRIYGYDNFAIHTAVAPLYPVRPDPVKTVEERVKDLFVKRFSLHEVHSYVWAYSDEYKALGMAVEDNIKLIGATNPNIETIRRSIIPTQLCQIKYNTGYAPSFGLFEIGRVANGLDEKTGLAREEKKLAVSLYSKAEEAESLYLRLRDMLAVLVDDIKHAPLSFRAVEATHDYEHPRNLNEVLLGGKVIGKLGMIHPTIAKKIDKKAIVAFAEIDIPALSAAEKIALHYEEPSRYPEMEIDLTFLADTFAPIGEAIAAVASPLIRRVRVVGTYRDAAGKTISVRLTFSDKQKTLTREEVGAVTDTIVSMLKNQGISMKEQ